MGRRNLGNIARQMSNVKPQKHRNGNGSHGRAHKDSASRSNNLKLDKGVISGRVLKKSSKSQQISEIAFHLENLKELSPVSNVDDHSGSDTDSSFDEIENSQYSEIRKNPKLKRYWNRRYELFNLFDKGIKLDEESWYSVTPEPLAQHIAQRCSCNVIVDAFCGAGGNSIQFAFTCQKVIAIDIDPNKIELARNNARVYGVEDRIHFIVGDFFKLSTRLTADIIFMSPPWGGLDYMRCKMYDLHTMLQPTSITKMYKAAKKVSERIAIFLPRNTNRSQLLDLLEPSNHVELEENYRDGKLLGITAYY